MQWLITKLNKTEIEFDSLLPATLMSCFLYRFPFTGTIYLQQSLYLLRGLYTYNRIYIPNGDCILTTESIFTTGTIYLQQSLYLLRRLYTYNRVYISNGNYILTTESIFTTGTIYLNGTILTTGTILKWVLVAPGMQGSLRMHNQIM